MRSQLVRILALIPLILGLAGCMGSEAFSAEDAAVRFGTETMSEGSVVDQSSIQIRQVREVGDKKYVLFSFERQNNNHHERCLMLYEARRTPLRMWFAGSGGGGCGGSVDGTEEIPKIDSGGGSSMGSDDPVGTSQAYGVVNDQNIVRVRVTWDDGAVFDADLFNSSYLVMRDGQFQSTMIEGLDADGAVVEQMDWDRAPGKE